MSLVEQIDFRMLYGMVPDELLDGLLHNIDGVLSTAKEATSRRSFFEPFCSSIGGAGRTFGLPSELAGGRDPITELIPFARTDCDWFIAAAYGARPNAKPAHVVMLFVEHFNGTALEITIPFSLNIFGGTRYFRAIARRVPRRVWRRRLILPDAVNGKEVYLFKTVPLMRLTEQVRRLAKAATYSDRVLQICLPPHADVSPALATFIRRQSGMVELGKVEGPGDLYMCAFRDGPTDDEIDGVDVGLNLDLARLRETVTGLLENGQVGSRFPVFMLHPGWEGRWERADFAQLTDELSAIREELGKLPAIPLLPGWQEVVAKEHRFEPTTAALSFIDVDGAPLVSRLLTLVRRAREQTVPIWFQ